jgi:hypothetical protein
MSICRQLELSFVSGLARSVTAQLSQGNGSVLYETLKALAVKWSLLSSELPISLLYCIQETALHLHIVL